jgi:hypothetical protein
MQDGEFEIQNTSPAIAESQSSRNVKAKKEPLYLNLEQTMAKKRMEKAAFEEPKPERSMIEMYAEIGAVRGPGNRKKPGEDRSKLALNVIGSKEVMSQVQSKVLEGGFTTNHEPLGYFKTNQLNKM